MYKERKKRYILNKNGEYYEQQNLNGMLGLVHEERREEQTEEYFWDLEWNTQNGQEIISVTYKDAKK